MKSIFIFRRDLRLDDNTGLIDALEQSESVLPCFIIDPRQFEAHPYRSEFGFQFLLESLVDLDEQLRKKKSRLYVFYGRPEEVIRKLTKRGFTSVYVNRDYTPFSIERDKALAKACEESGVKFNSFSDLLLYEPEEVGKMYKVYSAFRRFVQTLDIKIVQKNTFTNYVDENIDDEGLGFIEEHMDHNSKAYCKGGRKEGLKILKHIGSKTDYKVQRDYPAVHGTTGLSPHHKFGTVSVRETFCRVYEELGPEHTILSQLIWRDFFTHVAYYRPDVFGHAFIEKYDKIPWRKDTKDFERWTSGMTGFPIVDAGMRELNATGYMHNRARMIVASFLTKDLHIDWRMGERYFASKLIDYDPCVNNGSWQWSSSTGCDASPYFRVFNPWRQQERFDADCEYIKRWVPELAHLDAKTIHNLWKQRPLEIDYPKPMVEHKEEAEKAKLMFKVL